MEQLYGNRTTGVITSLRTDDPTIERLGLVPLHSMDICVQPGNVKRTPTDFHHSQSSQQWIAETWQVCKGEKDKARTAELYRDITRYGPETRTITMSNEFVGDVRRMLADYITVVSVTPYGHVMAVSNSRNYTLCFPPKVADALYDITVHVDGHLHPDDRHHIYRTLLQDVAAIIKPA